MKFFLRFLLCACALAQLSSCQSFNFTPVDQMVLFYIKNKTFPGSQVAIASQNSTYHFSVYGNYTYPGDPLNIPVKESTIWDMASCTKVIAATSAIMRLYEQGRVKLDDQLIKYVPEADNHGKSAITIRNLLLHNAGLTEDYPFGPVPNVTKQQMISWFFNMSLSYPVGTQYVYSDISMVFLQMVIERVSRQDLYTYTLYNFFVPMEMVYTMFTPSPVYKEFNRCAPTEVLNSTFRNETCTCDVHDPTAYILDGVSGDAGLFSNAIDLTKFMQMMLNGGVYVSDAGERKKIFEKDTVELFTTKATDVPYNNSRALGWDTVPISDHKACGDCFSERSFGHTGYTGTSVWADKEKNLTVIILTNRVYPHAERTTYAIQYFRYNLMNNICKVMHFVNQTEPTALFTA